MMLCSLSLPPSYWQGLIFLFLGGMIAGCEPPTPPEQASTQYKELLRVASAEAEARPDTSFFWLTNTGNPRARTLMLDLGVDYLHYDRGKGVLCVWTGEGLWPAWGYVTALPSATPQTDSVGLKCDIEGECSASAVTDMWAQFECR